MDKTIKPLTWDDVKVKKGKLVGMLTDGLAKSIFPTEDLRPNHVTIGTVHVPSNTGRKPIRKF